MAGESVADRLRHRRRFDPATAARIAADVARGLEVAHRRGGHRDIKPVNILLDADIGITRRLELPLVAHGRPYLARNG